MSAFEDFVNLELPRRPAMLTFSITAYDGDPTSGGAPAIVLLAPKGSFYLQDTGSVLWKKNTSTSGDWTQVSGENVTLAAVGSTPSANGASLSSQVLTLQPADGTLPGVLTAGAQEIGGAKTFLDFFTAQQGFSFAEGIVGSGGSIAETAFQGDAYNIGAGGEFTGGAGEISGTGGPGIRAFSGGINQNGGEFNSTNGTGAAISLNRGSTGSHISFANTTRSGLMTSTIAAASASSVIGAFTMKPVNALDATDLVLDVQNSALAHLFTVNQSGAIVALSTITGSNLSGTNTGNITLAAVGSTPAAEGASLSGQALTLQPASATLPGVVTAGTQSFGGAKTFGSTVDITGIITATAHLSFISEQRITATRTNADLVIESAMDAATASSTVCAINIRSTVALGATDLIVGFKTNTTTLVAGVNASGHVVGVAHMPLTATSSIVRGLFADGASAIGVVLDNSITLANATAKLVSIQNNAAEKIAIDLNGKFITPVGGAADVAGKSAAMVLGTITVNTTAVTADSNIQLTHAGAGVLANYGILYVSAVVAGTSFTITSTNLTDTDTVYWTIRN